jgi:hypothetical protein
MKTYARLMSDSEFERIIGPNCIGHGGSRSVHDVKEDQDVVIKKMLLPSVATNFFEFFLCNTVEKTRWRKFFGRCVAISASGQYLMMERLDDIQETDYQQTPTMPVWLNDVLPGAFGKNSAGEIKVRDYGLANVSDALAAALDDAEEYRCAWQGKFEPR